LKHRLNILFWQPDLPRCRATPTPDLEGRIKRYDLAVRGGMRLSGTIPAAFRSA
jgi:hypothetical protein